MTEQLTRTGVLHLRRVRRNWRDVLFGRTPPPAGTTPEPATTDGHIYASTAPEPGETTTALGRYLVQQPAARDLSLEQPTQVIPLLERTLRALDLEPAEALIYEQLAGRWRGLPQPEVDELGPAFDQEGGESRA
jgi:hypothetical protein